MLLNAQMCDDYSLLLVLSPPGSYNLSIEINSHQMTIVEVSCLLLGIYPIENGEYIPLIDTHILCNECLKMEDNLASSLAPMFVESCPLDDLRLQLIVGLRNELPRQCFNNSSRVDTVGEQVVELGSNLEQACRTAFLDDLICDLGNESFPVRGWDVRELCNVLTAYH